MNNVTGSLKEIDGVYYIVLNYKDKDGNYKHKRINTKLTVRGNKKAAEQQLQEALENFSIEEKQEKKPVNKIKLMDYIEEYVKSRKAVVEPTTYKSYLVSVDIEKRYFGDKLLKDITYKDILAFYEYLKEERNNKNITLKHHAVVMSPALRQAYRDDLIPKNPFEFMPKIKKEKHKMVYYTKEELEDMFKITDATSLGLIVRVAAFYGFRRSEVLGLKWKAIDFDKKQISIEHKVTEVDNVVYQKDKLKTDASFRTLPLLKEIEELLLKRKAEIEKNKKLYGKSYISKYDEYVFVDDYGELIKPKFVTDTFKKILKKNNLKRIRFHDLRHSCASLLLANGVPMKNIQEWLGHANFSTTADVYSHLDYSSKMQSANIIDEQLSSKKIELISLEELDREIAKLKKMIDEKESMKKKKQKNCEME